MKFLLLITLTFLTLPALAQVATQQNILQGVTPLNFDSLKLNEFIFDRVQYNDNIYSTSRKTELGDQSELSMSVRYHTSTMNFARFRFQTDPSDNRFNNKTSRFELIFSRLFNDKFLFQFDMELLTNDTEDDPDSGGTSLGLDLDSDDTFLSYMPNDKFRIIFYPFNFRSDVGDEFNTLDVSRINSIDGSPATIAANPTGGERVISKTVPGFELNFNHGSSTFYTGLGVVTYQFPTNGDYNIETNPTAQAWERKEAYAYKAGWLYLKGQDTKINFQYLGSTKTDETGALLQSAASLNIFKRINKFIFEFETTMSQAGKAPYNIDRTTNWFNNQTPFLPIFSDTSGNRQDWIDETGHAVSLKLGLNLKNKVTPFISLKYLSEHFIYDEEDSAHLLRNNLENLSHGGLKKFGIGAYIYHENLFFRPMIEFQQAENPVYTNSTDLRSDRQLSSFKKDNIQLSLNVTYTFDGSSNNQAWWF